ncbi:hypothetical protein [Amycolatopsis jejuensis]|uniref:hypothetical protein n=1 Tax=Amycolatopsis jejuensis TaxID=330084 RepID=UPI000691CFAA|nr:hypothetical protein [Amycolatopsis jejuensis]
MPDEVWPLTPDDHPRLSSTNGFGTELHGFTREDADGWRFATRWLTALGLPLVPLERYYLREVKTLDAMLDAVRGLPWTHRKRYELSGQSRLRAAEILRTYLFCWVAGPVFIALPVALLLSFADELAESAGVFLLVILFGSVLAGSIMGLSALHARYQEQWAPLRTVRWRDAPPPDWPVVD